MKTRLRTLKTKGFALVATLSLMILLTLIAVGLLTLSTVTVRAGGREEAMATARANARLALMIALGELQRTMGPDQGVSAPAAAVYADKTAQRPHLTGVWKGWHWTPTPGGSPTYSQKKGTFSRWLVSTTNPDDAKKFELPKSAAPTGTDSVRLVGSTTALNDSQGVSTQVLAEKVAIGDPATPSGKYAWAVFDESTKAPIHLGDPVTALKNGEEIASRTVPNRVRADVLDSKLGKLKTPEKLYSLETAVLPVGVSDRDEVSKRFHDFTTGSVGLLTDTANGGLKKDLTPLFEAATLPSQAFPVATVYPSAFGPTYGPPTWAYLYNHYRKYKTISVTSGVPTYNSRTGGDMTVTRGGSNGVISTPTNERLIPVIARFQMVFSVVTHDIFNVENRPTWWTQNGKPKYQKDARGKPNYGVLHLAYDPVVTLYNPYDVALDLTKIRFRIWDPPVAFRFKKYEYLTDQATGNFMAKRVVKEGYLRPTSTNDGFAGLAELQAANQSNTNARKCFTLVLSEGTKDGTSLTGQLKLQPGEVKVFSPRVEKTWTWGVETAGGWNQKGTFFDFAQEKKFANMDTRESANRPPNGLGPFGIECAPGWDGRAGLQTDHLALNAPRPSDTKYTFESTRNDGYVTLRSWDPIEVEVKPLVRSGNAAYHFQVDVLSATTQGNVPDTRDLENDSSNTGVRDDTLRSYKFNFSSLDPSKEISETPDAPIIKTKKLTCQELLQAENDNTKGGKYSFAMLELSARNTLDSLTDSKPWLHNNLVVEGGLQNSSIYGLTHQSYDLRLKKLEGTVDTFPRGIEIDPDTYRGYYGASGTVSEGSSFVTMNHVPLAPAASLGDLVSANLAASALMPRAVHPFGNSYSHPLIPADKVSKGLVVDHPYLLNDALWDSYFFSSFTDYAGGVISSNRSLKDVIKGTLDGSKPALNTRLMQVVSGDSSQLADKISALDALNRSKQIGKYTAINGAFNVNSASVDAWRAVLSSLRDRAIYGLNKEMKDTTYSNQDKTPFVRTGKPLADESETGALRWSAFRTLSDKQIETLAKEIVNQIGLRGKEDSAPSMTLGEFVNRRISNNTLQRETGLLQTAIDATDINKSAYSNDSKTVSASSINDVRKKGIENTAALDGNSGEGIPTVITQGDLMAALAPIATVRGDTFKIRAYGEALDATGKVITARAWCEAIVQRMPDYVDPADAPEVAPSSLTSQVNKDFGRQFRIVSFKQLSEDEL